MREVPPPSTILLSLQTILILDEHFSVRGINFVMNITTRGIHSRLLRSKRASKTNDVISYKLLVNSIVVSYPFHKDRILGNDAVKSTSYHVRYICISRKCVDDVPLKFLSNKKSFYYLRHRRSNLRRL